MNKTIIIIICCIFCTSAFGQRYSAKADSINVYITTIDTLNNKIDSCSFSNDSLVVNAWRYKNIIVAKSLLHKTTLSTTYYFKDEKLVLIRIIEHSPVYEKVYRCTELYFENYQIIFESHYGIRQIGVAQNLDGTSNPYRYNHKFTFDFVKAFSINWFSTLLKCHKQLSN